MPVSLWREIAMTAAADTGLVPMRVSKAVGLKGAEVVEPGVEVKLRLLDALDWQRSPCERGVLMWRGRAKGSCG